MTGDGGAVVQAGGQWHFIKTEAIETSAGVSQSEMESRNTAGESTASEQVRSQFKKCHMSCCRGILDECYTYVMKYSKLPHKRNFPLLYKVTH